MDPQNPVPQNLPPQPTPQASDQEHIIVTPNKSHTKTVLVVLILILVITNVAAAYFLLLRPRNEPPETPPTPIPSPTQIPTPQPTIEPKETPPARQITGPSTNLEFTTLVKESFGGIRANSQKVVNSQEELATLWSDIYPPTEAAAQPDLPTVDFDENTVLAVFQGWFGLKEHNIEIVGVEEAEELVEVLIKETFPQEGEPATAEETRPFHVVITSKITKEIAFTKI